MGRVLAARRQHPVQGWCSRLQLLRRRTNRGRPITWRETPRRPVPPGISTSASAELFPCKPSSVHRTYTSAAPLGPHPLAAHCTRRPLRAASVLQPRLIPAIPATSSPPPPAAAVPTSASSGPGPRRRSSRAHYDGDRDRPRAHQRPTTRTSDRSPPALRTIKVRDPHAVAPLVQRLRVCSSRHLPDKPSAGLQLEPVGWPMTDPARATAAPGGLWRGSSPARATRCAWDAEHGAAVPTQRH